MTKWIESWDEKLYNVDHICCISIQEKVPEQQTDEKILLYALYIATTNEFHEYLQISDWMKAKEIQKEHDRLILFLSKNELNIHIIRR